MQAEGLEPIAADFQSLYAALLLVSATKMAGSRNVPTTRRTSWAWWNTSARRLPAARWPTICPWSPRFRSGRTGRAIGRWRRCLAARLARKRLTQALTRSCGGWAKGTARSVRSVWRRSADGTTRRKSRKRTHGGWRRCEPAAVSPAADGGVVQLTNPLGLSEGQTNTARRIFGQLRRRLLKCQCSRRSSDDYVA